MKTKTPVALMVFALLSSAFAGASSSSSLKLLVELDKDAQSQAVNDIGSLVQREIGAATRWRLVNVNIGLLLSAGITADKIDRLPPQAPPITHDVGIRDISLNFFDDIEQGFDEITKAQSNSLKETGWVCKGGERRVPKSQTIYTTLYEVTLAGVSKTPRIIGLNHIPVNIVNGRAVSLETRFNGKTYRLHPVAKDLERSNSQSVPHIVLEFDESLPGTKELFTWSEPDMTQTASEADKQLIKQLISEANTEYQTKYKDQGCKSVVLR